MALCGELVLEETCRKTDYGTMNAGIKNVSDTILSSRALRSRLLRVIIMKSCWLSLHSPLLPRSVSG